MALAESIGGSPGEMEGRERQWQRVLGGDSCVSPGSVEKKPGQKGNAKVANDVDTDVTVVVVAIFLAFFGINPMQEGLTA